MKHLKRLHTAVDFCASHACASRTISSELCQTKQMAVYCYFGWVCSSECVCVCLQSRCTRTYRRARSPNSIKIYTCIAFIRVRTHSLSFFGLVFVYSIALFPFHSQWNRQKLNWERTNLVLLSFYFSTKRKPFALQKFWSFHYKLNCVGHSEWSPSFTAIDKRKI